MKSVLSRVRRDERGAFLIVFALCILALVLIIALVIDLGFTRADRRNGQLAVDNAASSSAQTFAETGSSQAACDDAFDFTAATLDVDPFVDQDCLLLPLACSALTSPVQTSGRSGDYVLTVTYPVADDTALMARVSAVGNSGIAAGPDDGDPCERLGVELTSRGEPFFGGVAGSTERSTVVHAVARIGDGNNLERPLNLLALERRDCGAFVLSGLGDVLVASVVNALGVRQEGIAAVDSNGSTACGGNAATLEATGQGSLIAYGPCEADPTAECAGEGRIPLMASFNTGACDGTADTPGCREGANADIEPMVEASPGLFTRAPLDHRYNCKASYAGEAWYGGTLQQPIDACDDPTVNSAYVDDLEAYVASIRGMSPSDRLLPANGAWQTIGGSNPACSVSDITYVGNVFVDCNDFRPGPNVVFAGGNVIFRDQVTVNSPTSALRVHAPCPSPPPVAPSPECAPPVSWSTAGDPFDERQSSSAAGWVHVGGSLSMNSGSLTGEFVSMFLGSSSRLNVTGGNFVWEAPDSLGPFDDLAVWSEGTAVHTLGGNGNIDVVGVLFTGQATFDYAGNAPQIMDEAQFVANKLRFTGGSSLRMAPAADRNVDFPVDPTFNLIR